MKPQETDVEITLQETIVPEHFYHGHNSFYIPLDQKDSLYESILNTLSPLASVIKDKRHKGTIKFEQSPEKAKETGTDNLYLEKTLMTPYTSLDDDIKVRIVFYVSYTRPDMCLVDITRIYGDSFFFVDIMKSSVYPLLENVGGEAACQ